jgi:Tfp pilus assembly protein PilF
MRRSHAVLAVVLLFALAGPGCVTRQRAEKALSHQKMGQVYFDDGDFPGTVGELREAIRLNPHHPEAHHLLANAYFAMERHDDAHAEYRIATRLQNPFPEACVNWGALLAAEGRWEESLEKLQIAVDEPTYREVGRAYHNMGWAHFQLGQFEEAREAYKRVLTVTGQFCPSVLNLGMVAEAQGDLVEAEELYLEAMDCNDRDLNTWYQLGQLYIRLDRVEDAKYYLDFVAAHDDGGPLGEQAGSLLDDLPG